MSLVTLCVTHRWSDAGCIPTQSVGTIKNTLMRFVPQHILYFFLRSVLIVK
jgi:hypothetical protein